MSFNLEAVAVIYTFPEERGICGFCGKEENEVLRFIFELRVPRPLRFSFLQRVRAFELFSFGLGRGRLKYPETHLVF